MKKLFLIAISMIGFCSLAQNNFDVVQVGTQYSSQQIIAALNDANLCGIYYSSKNRVMMFDDGSVVHLKKENELPSLDSNCFIDESPAHKNEYWEISSNGHLIRRIQTVGK